MPNPVLIKFVLAFSTITTNLRDSLGRPPKFPNNLKDLPAMSQEGGHSCAAKCNLPDTSRMVACDRCGLWWHFECVNIGDSINEKDFLCPKCKSEAEPPRNTSVAGSISSASSSQRRALLELKKLEEIKALQLQQLDIDRREQEQRFELEKLQHTTAMERKKLELEKKFLDDKYRVMTKEDGDDDDGRSQKSARSSDSNVLRWKVDRLLASTTVTTIASTLPETASAPATTATANISVGQVRISDDPVQSASGISKQPATTTSGPLSGTNINNPANKVYTAVSNVMPNYIPINTYVSTSIREPILSTGTIPKRNTFPTTSNLPTMQLPSAALPQVPGQQYSLNPGKSNPSFVYPNISRCAPSAGAELYPPSQPISTAADCGPIFFPQPGAAPFATHAERAYRMPGSFVPEQFVAVPTLNDSSYPGPNDYLTFFPTHPGATIIQGDVPARANFDAANDSGGFEQHMNSRAFQGPTPQQLAARQFMARDLPTFSGDPEDWPLFSSMYYNSSQSCGLSDTENLMRLQRSLRGQAFEAVRSKLLLPNCVPEVMETLKALFGRPEMLIQNLLKKVKETPAPKSDKLESLIAFGTVVRNLTDHLIAGGQVAHLNNPNLLFDLVQKLPADRQIQWVMYKGQFSDPNLRTFAHFLSILVNAASEVTPFLNSKPDSRQPKSGGSGARGFIHTHIAQNTKVEVPNSSVESSGNNDKMCKVCRKSDHRVKDCVEFRNKSVEDPSVNSHRHANRSSLFRILPVTLHFGGRSVNVFAFFDDGSSITLVENSIAEDLGIEGKGGILCLTWTADVTRDEPNSKWVSFDISGENSAHRYHLNNVRTVDNLALPGQTLEYKRLSEQYPHLSGIPMIDYQNAVPKILIGNDNAHLAVPLRRREGSSDAPIATKSRLGWTIHGPIFEHTKSGPQYNFHLCQCSTKLETLHDLVKQSFTVENLGISFRGTSESDEDRRARNILEATTRRVGQRFETGLLFKYDYLEFPDSRPMALRRMQCLERRMAADPVIGNSVRKQISEYLQKGYLRKATETDLNETDPRRVWYLPLGIVINPKKPGKIRIFCDAAAKVDGVSLNSVLIKGPDLLLSLPRVLCGFREKKVAVCADIREMFHQVLIRDADVQVQRILWRDDPKLEPTVFLMKVATFGATCSPCSAQYVKNKNAKEFELQYPAAVNSIIHHHYMDDYLESFDTEEEAAQRAREIKYVHAQAGFEIHSWSSNSERVLNVVGEADPSAVKRFDTSVECETERILGMLWLRQEDSFTFSSNFASIPDWPTKREVLRTVMSLYDPLGLLSHFTIHGKILIQDIWRSGISWDHPIPESLQVSWKRWVSLFSELDKIRIPRCYFPECVSTELDDLQLHMFVDASEAAYGCAAYLRATVEGAVRCVLVAAKTKVAPLKTLSIPRLELQAALIGSRLLENVNTMHSYKVRQRFIWSDSKTVMSWINSDQRKFNQFVACRVGEILERTDVSEWRWIPTKLNVADDMTKWASPPDFSSSGRWFLGPDFLYEDVETWPRQNSIVEETNEECRNRNVERVTVHAAYEPEPMINWRNFSQWNRLVRAASYVYRYLWNLRRTAKEEPLKLGLLDQEEIEAGEMFVYRCIQKESFAEELALLKRSRSPDGKSRTLKPTSKLSQLSPFIDDRGVLRMESRISVAAFVSYDTRNPIILPPESRATHLLVHEMHKKYLHQNHETVVNEIRQKFHVSRLKSLVRRVSKDCLHCRVSSRRSTVKRWVALFTCLTIRAVHLEVVHSLTTMSCKMAVRRFVGRRGSPVEIYSDNGTNFCGARNELMKDWDEINHHLANSFTNSKTKWRLNPPSAPHMGGAWERLVRSVKVAFYAMSTTKTPNEETFATLIVEAEAIVNSRPLTFVSLENDSQEALTPNHFMLLSSSGTVQPPKETLEPKLATRDDWNLNRHLADMFWHRWVKEYLPVIARRTKWFSETKVLECGDLVVVVDETLRNGWLRGRVTEVRTGADGRVRQAVVQTSSGIVTRPVAKIAVLDLCTRKPSMDTLPYGRGDVTAALNGPSDHSRTPRLTEQNDRN
ncbi:uncharacterized protein LOC129752651 [Uranotaenia lowii]|uniref:uncharacterized protein LOC129752651 n=1 Tax=Uranotaenia lowii TaxID=190385 RepID=UPI002479190D|nr:uncharacterized protein LOC129752651 [Uranotaenia lowii]